MGFRTIEELCEELKAKRVSALAGGGEKAVAKQKGRLGSGSINSWMRVPLWRSTNM